jgi:hypothetical protein
LEVQEQVKQTTLLNILEEKIAEGYNPLKIGYFSFTRRAIKEARNTNN